MTLIQMEQILITIIASTGFWGIVGLLLQNHFNKKNSENAKVKMIEDGILALLHDRMYEAAEVLKERKEIDEPITIAELHNIEYIYNAYKLLGGNGTGDKIFDDIKNYTE